jgi:hypothetical protein
MKNLTKIMKIIDLEVDQEKEIDLEIEKRVKLIFQLSETFIFTTNFNLNKQISSLFILIFTYNYN